MLDRIKSHLTSRPARLCTAALLLILGLWCILDSEGVAERTFYTALNDRAMNLIDETLERDQVTFLVITAIKGSLAVIEGSSVGVGFELEVGDVVQPAYDYVDFFWKAFLYAFLIMGFYKLLLETGLLMLGIALSGIGLVLVSISLVAKVQQIDLRQWGRRCLLMGILFAYVAPLSLLLTEYLNGKYTAGIKETHFETIQAYDTQLKITAMRFMQLKSEISILQPTQSIETLKTNMLALVNQAAETFRLSLLAFLYYVLIIMFELLLFPILSAVFLYKFTQFALGRLLIKPMPVIIQQVNTPNPAPAPAS